MGVPDSRPNLPLPSLPDMENPSTQRAVSEPARQCVDLFHQCLSQSQQLGHGPSDALVEDQCGRFMIWASNIGVFAAGHASMDHRLREAPDIKDLLIRLLEVLLGHIDKSE